MRELFTIDLKNYDINGTTVSRPSARALIIRDGKIAMIHSLKYDYYKFPGGGIEPDESKEDALVREVAEETGLCVKRSSIREFGHVYRIQKGDWEDVFIQDNYYYLCDVKDGISEQHLDDYEKDERFTLEYVSPQDAIRVNRANRIEIADLIMMEREAKILEILMQEGYL